MCSAWTCPRWATNAPWRRRRKPASKDRVQFRLGDIQDIDLPPDSFDVVITYDTWCHIPQRAALIKRCAALLKPGGRMAIFDHVERRPAARRAGASTSSRCGIFPSWKRRRATPRRWRRPASA